MFILELDVERTRDNFLRSGRKYASYAAIHGWSAASFRSYMIGADPLRPGSRAWNKYVTVLERDGIAVFR